MDGVRMAVISNRLDAVVCGIFVVLCALTTVLFLGVALPGDRFHAPNERMVMDQFWKGLLAAGELFVELGAL